MNKKPLIATLILTATIILLGIIAISCAQPQGQPPAPVPEPQSSLSGDASKGNTDTGSPATPPQIAEPPQKEQQAAKIGDVLNRPNAFAGTKIVIEGKIVSECPSGCWFTINDGTGTIYVDLAPSNLTIPQKRGALARVYGRVVQKGGDIYIIGEKVEF